jgi:hypothetical protein
MSVLIEAISVIVQKRAIEERFPGGWAAFEDAVPNGTLCADDDLARVGFMSPPDAKAFVAELETQGLRFLVDGVAGDIAVVDQQQGLLNPCAWLEFGRVSLDGNTSVAACWSPEGAGAAGPLATPEGWEFEGSLSQHFQFVPTEQVDQRLHLLHRDADHEIYLDLRTGKEISIARTRDESGDEDDGRTE